jgi:excisionase family DNA binding protein
MNIEATYDHYLKINSEPVAAASLVLAQVTAAAQALESRAAVPVDAEYLNVKQAASLFQLGERTVYRLVETNEVSSSRVRKAIRIKRAELERYLEGRETLFG